MSHRRFARIVGTAFAGTLLLAPVATAAPAFASVTASITVAERQVGAQTSIVQSETDPTGDGIEYRDEDGNLVDPTDVEHTGYDRSTLARDEVVGDNPADPVEESPIVQADEHAGRIWPWIFPAIAVAGLGYYLYHLWQRRQHADPNGPLGQS